MYLKRHEPCVLFLEDAFGSGDGPATLRKAGYEVERFVEHFPDKLRKVEQGVKDPRIIRLCDQRKFVLVTTDKELWVTHSATIKETEILVVATANNNQPISVWVDALVLAKTRLERYHRRGVRPSFLTLSMNGTLHPKSPSQRQRRHRPKEGQE